MEMMETKMSDDLVKRLREGLYDLDIQAMLSPLLDEAADRIEELERERDDFHKEAMFHIELWGKALAENTKLEAKLAKAVEALRLYACACDGGFCHANGNFCGGDASATLAEIEGGK